MYRIMIARNGRYYAQKHGRFGWFRISPFMFSLAGAKGYVREDKTRWAAGYREYTPYPRAVEYL